MNPAGTSHFEAHVPLTTDKILSGPRSLGGRRELIRRNPYSLSTESAGLRWARRYILFQGQQPLMKMGAAEIIAGSQPSPPPSTRVPSRSDASTPVKQASRPMASTSPAVVIPSSPIGWKTVTTSAPCGNASVTVMRGPP